MDERSANLDLLAAERAIERTVLRYCRGIDRLQLDLVRSCFHPDAIDDHGGAERSVDDFLAWVEHLLEGYASTMHLLGNLLVEVAGDVALAEAYGIAFHRGRDDQPFEARRNLMTGFRYVDRFTRRDGRWAIEHRVATTEFSRVDDTEGRWPFPESMRLGARDRSDPVFRLVPEVTG